MKKLLPLMLGIVIMAQGCQTQSGLSDADKDAMVQAVKHTSQEYWAVWSSTYDTTTISKYKKFIDVSSDQMWQTEPIAAIYLTKVYNKQDESIAQARSMIENRISGIINVQKAHYSVLSDNKVLEVLEGDFSIVFKDNTESGSIEWVGTSIWTNKAGDWKIQFIHNSYQPKSE